MSFRVNIFFTYLKGRASVRHREREIMCVCVKERGRERGREGERECVREREREVGREITFIL